MSLIIAVLALGGMAAAGFEIWLAMRQHPRRFAYAWMAWTPLAMLSVGAGVWDSVNPVGSVGLALVMGVVAYPFFRAMIWLRLTRYSSAEEDAKDLERMAYQAVDFGGVRTAPPQPSAPKPPAKVAIVSPIAAPTRESRLDRATRDYRPAWVRGAEITFIVGVCAIGISLYLFSMISDLRPEAEPSHEEMIAATLEFNGYAGPRVENLGDVCADGRSLAYRWSTMGAAGRACVDRDGQVSLWVEKRWPAVR